MLNPSSSDAFRPQKYWSLRPDSDLKIAMNASFGDSSETAEDDRRRSILDWTKWYIFYYPDKEGDICLDLSSQHPVLVLQSITTLMPLAVVELREVRCVTLEATCVCAHLRGKLFIFPRYFTSLVKRSDILSFLSTKLYGFCYIRRFYQAAPFSDEVCVEELSSVYVERSREGQ
jgi:hypothetical protein